MKIMTSWQINIRIVTCAVAFAALSACQTVSMPSLDFVKSPEFSEDAANIATDFPEPEDAPLEPTDVRSRAQWDRDARAILALRNRPRGIADQGALTVNQGDARYEELKAKAQAYKKDDPASGPVEGFPKYKPRR